MRSHEVYSAVGRIENRYLLCSMVRVAARKLHKPGTPLQHTISNVLGIINQRSRLRDSPGVRAWRALSPALKAFETAKSAA